MQVVYVKFYIIIKSFESYDVTYFKKSIQEWQEDLSRMISLSLLFLW